MHYNSDKPAEVGALAYTQGINIHVAPGQERYLPHEAWYVVQQAQGRVQPTMQLKGEALNNDNNLKKESDEIGERVLRMKTYSENKIGAQCEVILNKNVIQKVNILTAGQSDELEQIRDSFAGIFNKVRTFYEKEAKRPPNQKFPNTYKIWVDYLFNDLLQLLDLFPQNINDINLSAL